MAVYNFSWEQMGNMELGRPNLGMTTRVEVYRMMQYTMRAVLEKELGDGVTKQLFHEAGCLAGMEFCNNIMDKTLPLNAFVAQLHGKLLEYNIGILKIEQMDAEALRFVLTISEDLDCSGLPVGGFTVCDYDEGFLQGVLRNYTGKDFDVKEIDCWSTGDRTCRFSINLKEN
jgi:uncharacterized protein